MKIRRLVAMPAFVLALSVSGADLYLAGDSTMCDYSDRYAPQQGWGHELAAYCAAGVKPVNFARGGRSVKSFRAEKLWDRLLEKVKAGDFVIIQFGHNDANFKKQERYADYRKEFPELLTQCIREVREKNAIPVLATQTAYWGFDKNNGKLSNGSGQHYIDALKQVAAAEKVDLVDLNAIAMARMLELGPEKTKSFYLFSSVKGKEKDKLHLSVDGARAYAGWFVEEARARRLPIADCFQIKP